MSAYSQRMCALNAPESLELLHKPLNLECLGFLGCFPDVFQAMMLTSYRNKEHACVAAFYMLNIPVCLSPSGKGLPGNGSVNKAHKEMTNHTYLLRVGLHLSLHDPLPFVRHLCVKSSSEQAEAWKKGLIIKTIGV